MAVEKEIGVVDQTAAGNANAQPIDLVQLTSWLGNILRQVIVQGDPNNPASLALVNPEGMRHVIDFTMVDLMTRSLKELICIRRSLNELARTQFHPDQVDILNTQT